MEPNALSPDTRLAMQNIAAALGCPIDAAVARALEVERILRRHRDLASHPRQALKALLAMEDPLGADDWRWLRARRSGPFVLALPLTLSAMSIVARLFERGEHFLCIEETSVTAPLLRFLGQLHRGAKQLHLGATSPTRDFTFVEDTAAGFLAVATCDRAIGQVVNLGSGEEISIGDLVRLLIDITGSEASIVADEARLRPAGSEVERLLADNTRAREWTGWTPTVSLRDGLARTSEWVREHLELLDTAGYSV